MGATPRSAAQCQLSFAEVGVFRTRQLDVVLSDARTAGPAGSATRDRPRALAVTEPVAGTGERPAGYVALVLPLPGLAAGLADTSGRPQQYTFTVRDAGWHRHGEACLDSGGRTLNLRGDSEPRREIVLRV